MRRRKWGKTIRRLFEQYLQPLGYFSVLLVIFGGLLWYRLDSLVKPSTLEAATLGTTNSLHHLFNNPVNAPFNLVAYVLGFVAQHNIFWGRFAATLFGLFTLSAFFWLVRLWHGERTALMGTIVFGSSAWFLHVSRSGTPEVLFFTALCLVAFLLWLKRTENWVLLLIYAILGASVLYIPGMVWLILAGVVWRFGAIKSLLKINYWLSALFGLTAAGLLTPLILAIYKSPQLLKTMAGLPVNGWPMPLEILKNLLSVPTHLFLRGPSLPEQWLGRLPVIDIFCIVMFLLGLFTYLKHHRLDRVKLIAVVIGIGTVLASLGGQVSISFIVPFIYFLIAAGMGLMLDRWFNVFPRNTIAQIFGIVLISLAIAASCWYNLRHYYIAWPNRLVTSAVENRKTIS